MLVLCGKTAAGKDTLLKVLRDAHGFKPIVSYTTRPMREGEVQDREYHFVTREEFEFMEAIGEFAETTSYNVASGETWLYGSAKSDFIEANKRSIIILNPDGVKQLRKIVDAKSVVALILTDENETWNRLRQRGDDNAEARRRMNADDEDFSDINDHIDFAIRNDGNVSPEHIAHLICVIYEYMNDVK